jgi:6-pyruvoyl-tetrahydropterin synthase
MRWVIHAAAEFDASHALRFYRGKPESVHEHRWRIAVRVGAESLDTEGYALDFHLVQQMLEQAVSPLSETDLSKHPEIGTPSPTAERLAEVTASWLQAPLEKAGGRLLTVSVWEGPDNRVDFNLE